MDEERQDTDNVVSCSHVGFVFNCRCISLRQRRGTANTHNTDGQSCAARAPPTPQRGALAGRRGEMGRGGRSLDAGWSDGGSIANLRVRRARARSTCGLLRLLSSVTLCGACLMSLWSLKPECMGRVVSGGHLFIFSPSWRVGVRADVYDCTVLAHAFVYVVRTQHLSWFPASFGTILLAAACTWPLPHYHSRSHARVSPTRRTCW